MNVYIIGTSGYHEEIERAKRWHSALTRIGMVVVSTWIASVENAGAGNPPSASREQRAEWAQGCLKELRSADVAWFLVPPRHHPTCGGWFELGAACQRLSALHAPDHGVPRLITSGGRSDSRSDTRQSIFCALTQEFEEDLDAFIEIVRLKLGVTIADWIQPGSLGAPT